MDNQKHDSKFSRFLSGKGFYVALAVCLIGTATAAWVAIDSTQNALLEKSSSQLSSSQSRISSSTRTSISSSTSSSRTASTPTTQSRAANSTAPSSSSGKVSSSTPAAEPVTDEPVSSAAAAAGEENPPAEDVNAPVEDIAVDEALFATQEPLAFTMPIDGEVFGMYSQGELVRNVTLGEWRTHDGIDIRASKGSPVRAVADGVVSQVYQDPMWGTVVEITHAGGLTSITSGLDPAVAVKQGDSVRIEDTIGVVGSILSEISLEDHIHFGLKQDGNWVDPIAAMGKAIQ